MGNPIQEIYQEISQKHVDIFQNYPKQPSDEFLNLLQELEMACTNQIFIHEVSELAYLDYMASFGERLSAKMLSELLENRTIFVDSRQFFLTNKQFTNANVDYPLSEIQTKEYFQANSGFEVYVVTGFIARSSSGETTTLGRGGSDFTAGLLANFLDASEVEIWTDVDGILSMDPRIVPEARVIPQLSYREAFKVAYYGGKVLYPKTMEACLSKQIKILIKNTFNPETLGTLVSTEEKSGLKVISRAKNIIIVEILFAGITSEIGLLSKIFTWFAEEQITVDIVTTSGDSVSFSCDKTPSMSLKTRIEKEIGEKQEIIALIGTDIVNQPKFTEILNLISKYQPKMLPMNTKNTNFTTVLDNSKGEDLVKAVHQILLATD